MPPTNLPPTPAASGEFTIRESSFHAMDAMSEHSFALPPAALSPTLLDGSANPSSRKGSMVAQTPISPASPGMAAATERRSSTSISARVGTKRAAVPSSTALDEFNLPPPPTRSRKIIQMKPKTAASSSSDAIATTTPSARQPSQKKAAPKSGSAALSKNSNTLAAAGTATNTTNTSPTSQQSSNNNNGSKRKQPSATSAAGRKIARKTAHSLIERRRRSKMNEEFATLKDMIPACRGQEMHKLAILQASIDYMNYLEECITELKNNASLAAGRTNSMSKKLKLDAPPLAPPSPTSPELIMPPIQGSEESAGSQSSSSSSSSPELHPHHTRSTPTATATAASPAAYYSPSFSPYTAPTPSHQVTQSLDSGNHPILPSPALRPLYSPQIRPQPQTPLDPQQQQTTSNHSTTSWRVQQPIASTTPSPAIQPQQHRQSLPAGVASPMFLANDSMIDHEASAALLMLNMDRRGLSISERGEGERRVEKSHSTSSSSNERKMGMSVRDLLTS